MIEKRFLLDKLEKGNAILSVKITDTVKDVDYFIMTKEFYEDEIDDIVDLLNEQEDSMTELQNILFAKEKTIDRLENTLLHLTEADGYLEKNRKITELADIGYNVKMVLSNDEEQLAKVINEQQAEIERLKEQLSLVCKAESSAPYNSVKEVLRRQIFGLDCAAEESPNAWHHYHLLSKLFEEQYGEYWDNFD